MDLQSLPHLRVHSAIDPNRLDPVQIAAPLTPRNIHVPFANVETKYEVVSAFA